jgi:aminoglycoside phosphotransferase (APT) family kinase protein
VSEPAISIEQLPARVRAAVRASWPDTDVAELRPLEGGISSLTFSATVTGPGVPVVVKMAPPGLEPVRNRDVLRQARVMNAVHGAAGVQVPAVLARDAAPPPFFVMEFVDGESYEPKWDESASPPGPAVVGARARAAARMLARLQAIDPAAAELGDEPVLSPADELDRWARLYATAGDDLRGDETRLRDALAAAPPDALAAAPPDAPGRAHPAILHGDYRLGNMQFDGERLAAIIDWEIWSLGDPRHDLAWLLLFTDPVMQRAAARDAANLAAAGGMPSAEELLGEYLSEARAGTPPPDLNWFRALAHYKLGATMSVLTKRNRRLADPDPGLEVTAATTPQSLQRGLELLG